MKEVTLKPRVLLNASRGLYGCNLNVLKTNFENFGVCVSVYIRFKNASTINFKSQQFFKELYVNE